MRAKLLIKQTEVALLQEKFQRSVSAVLVDFRGIPVSMLSELRSRLKEVGVEYKVIKNNLVRRALADAAFAKDETFLSYLKGPTGVAWSYEDPSAAAKIIKAFRKESEDKEKLTVKCGLLEREVLSGVRVENELATLPGKDEMRSSLLAQLLAPAQALVRQLAAPGQNFAYALGARERQLTSSDA